jgi:hypothetical protein
MMTFHGNLREVEEMISIMKQDDLDFQSKLQALRVDETHPHYKLIEKILRKTAAKK